MARILLIDTDQGFIDTLSAKIRALGHQVDAAQPLLAQRTPRLIPFADRLPPAILAALEQGGLVSSPLPGCDYSPLGNIGELIHSGHWQSGTAAPPGASAPGG